MSVTDYDVKQIIDTKKDCTPFIATALLIVAEQILAVSSSMSSARQDQVTLYLAAHFVWNAESNGLVSSDIEHVREAYKTFSDKSFGLATSRYGQMAMTLDTSGTLNKLAVQAGLPAQFKTYHERHRHRGWGSCW